MRRQLLSRLWVLFLAAAVCALSLHVPSSASELETEEFRFLGTTYEKVVGMPFYPVPFVVPRTFMEHYVDKAVEEGKEENIFHPRQVMTVQFILDEEYEEKYDTKVYRDNSYVLCDGNIIMNDDVPLVELHEVWPDYRMPRDTLAVFDGDQFYIPVGIETWADLYRNTTGWPEGVDEHTFVMPGIIWEHVEDWDRNPFIPPKDAWISLVINDIMPPLNQKAKYQEDSPIVDNDLVYTQVISLARKVWVVAERQPDFSYKFYFLKKYNAANPDFSEKNDLGSAETAVAYLRGR